MSSDIVSYLWEKHLKHQAICPLKYKHEAQHAKYREKSVRDLKLYFLKQKEGTKFKDQELVAKLTTIFRGEIQNKKNKNFNCSSSFPYFQMTPTCSHLFPPFPFFIIERKEERRLLYTGSNQPELSGVRQKQEILFWQIIFFIDKTRKKLFQHEVDIKSYLIEYMYE